jgi:hypothetical protein
MVCEYETNSQDMTRIKTNLSAQKNPVKLKYKEANDCHREKNFFSTGIQ